MCFSKGGIAAYSRSNSLEKILCFINWNCDRPNSWRHSLESPHSKYTQYIFHEPQRPSFPMYTDIGISWFFVHFCVLHADSASRQISPFFAISFFWSLIVYYKNFWMNAAFFVKEHYITLRLVSEKRQKMFDQVEKSEFQAAAFQKDIINFRHWRLFRNGILSNFKLGLKMNLIVPPKCTPNASCTDFILKLK